MKDPDRTPVWQRIFLVLLLVCIAQVSYWVVEQIGHARNIRDTELARYSSYTTLKQSRDEKPLQLLAAVNRHIEEDAALPGYASPGEDPVLAIHEDCNF